MRLPQHTQLCARAAVAHEHEGDKALTLSPPPPPSSPLSPPPLLLSLPLALAGLAAGRRCTGSPAYATVAPPVAGRAQAAGRQPLASNRGLGQRPLAAGQRCTAQTAGRKLLLQAAAPAAAEPAAAVAGQQHAVAE